MMGEGLLKIAYRGKSSRIRSPFCYAAGDLT